MANITLGSNTSIVTFSSISQSYRDLILVFNGTVAGSNGSVIFQLNGDTAVNYSRVSMTGDGSSTNSASGTHNVGIVAGWQYAVTIGNQVVGINHFMDYSATDKHKTILNRGNTAAQFAEASAMRWPNTSAITSILIANNGGGTLAAGSTIALYGIAS